MFKKIFIPIILAVCLALTFFVNNFPVFYSYSNSLEIYDKGKSSGNIISISNFSAIFRHKYGEAFVTEKNQFQLQNFLKDFNAKIIFFEEIEKGTCYYAYSPKIKYFESINGEIINLHIYIGEVSVKVGSPLIYGGY